METEAIIIDEAKDLTEEDIETIMNRLLPGQSNFKVFSFTADKDIFAEEN